MARLPRPYIPLAVKCRVAMRQIGEDASIIDCHRNLKQLLAECLGRLAVKLGCDVTDLRLDHNPALAIRTKVRFGAGTVIEYIPSASDPEFLVYRSAIDHHIKTNVRGDGAQYPDRVLIKRERRRDRPPKQKVKIKGRTKWPKRPFQKRRKEPK